MHVKVGLRLCSPPWPCCRSRFPPRPLFGSKASTRRRRRKPAARRRQAGAHPYEQVVTFELGTTAPDGEGKVWADDA